MQGKRVFYNGFLDEGLFIVDYLFEKHQWEPVLFTAPDRMFPQFEENHPVSLSRAGPMGMTGKKKWFVDQVKNQNDRTRLN